jgi:putative Ca2+/H+ antiporter (TMEM165/GDT1 family)
VISDIFVPFAAVGLAELGDKTQLTVLCLASKTRRHFELLLGIIFAFVIADGSAVILGNFIRTAHIPVYYIKTASGMIFILFGIIALMSKKQEDAACSLKKPFASGFLFIFISEMGDKTQIAAGLFATKFEPAMVFIGVISALTILSVMAIYLGKFIALKLNRKIVSNIAGIVFILVGVFCLF